MKKLCFEVNTKTRRVIFDKLFNVFLFLSKYGYYSVSHDNKYDHLGIIDTLGSSVSITRFTAHYSSEMTSLYVIKLPFGYGLFLENTCEKYVFIAKNNIQLY